MGVLVRRPLESAATAVGGITLAILLLFLFGEMSGGDLSGLQHLVQVLPLAVLLALGWRYPSLAGSLLMAIGLALAATYFLQTQSDSVSQGERLLVATIFLLPPVVAGALFLLAARER